jgi:hypothetical protein
MLDGTIRHQQSMFELMIIPILHRMLDELLHEGGVFRMDPLEDESHGRLRRSVVFEDSKGFL